MEHVATGEHDSHDGVGRPLEFEEQLGHRRRHEADRDLFVGHPLRERDRGHGGRVVGDVEARAGREVRPHLPDRRVEGGAGEDRGAIVGRDRERLACQSISVRGSRARHLHPLGLAGRSRRVDDVRDVGRSGHRLGGLAGIERAGVELGVEVEHGARERPEPRDDRCIREQHGDAGVGAQIVEARVRMGGIEPDVAAARSEHGQRTDNRRDRAVVADRDENAGFHAQGTKASRQCVGRGVQLGIGQAAVAVGNRQPVQGRPWKGIEEIIHESAVRLERDVANDDTPPD